MQDQVTAAGKMLSLEERVSRIRSAFYALYDEYDIDSPWMVDVYEDHVIVATGSAEYARVTYTLGDDGVTFAPRAEWQPVEKEWAAKIANTLIYPGGAIKALGGGKLGGYLVVFTDEAHPDLEGEFFTKTTAFEFEDGHQVGVYYQHGLDATIKSRRVGRGALKLEDAGVWLDAQLDLRDDYERAIYSMAEQGKLGWSSGAVAHLVEREPVGKSVHIKRWIIGEASLTPTPAEPRTRALPLKSLIPVGDPTVENSPKSPAGGATPEAAPEAGQPAGAAAKRSPTTTASLQVNDIDTEDTMPENTAPETPVQNDAPDLKSLSATLNEVLDFIKGSPELKRAGYTTDDGGKADPSHKSMGDYLIAVMRGDDVRLRKVYGSNKTLPLYEGETKALNTQDGSAGGYTVPTDFSTSLLQISQESSPIVAAVRRIPVSAPAGEYPALDQYTAPTAGSGNTAMAGNMTSAIRAEGGSYTEDEPEFEMIRYRITDAASGMVKVTKELRADSIIGIESFLRQVIGVAVGSKLEYYILNGNGAGQPLGILNAPALISVTPDTNNLFAYADAVEMTSRFKVVGGKPMWLHHMGMITDIANFEVGTGGSVLVSNPTGAVSPYLLGYQRVMSEHLPQPDNSGCVVLADLGSYVLFEKGGLYIEFSEHANFSTGHDTWRFGMRCDGQPWQKNVITLADPQGSYTVSPFVKFDD